MAPKARAKSRGTSPRPKARAKATEVAPDPSALRLKDAEECFVKYQSNGDLKGVLKLPAFAQIINDTNEARDQVFGADMESIIRSEWRSIEGHIKREIGIVDFAAWYATFRETVEVKQAQKVHAKAEADARLAVAASALDDTCCGDGVWTVPMKDLKEVLRRVVEKGKTPLILDTTENQRVALYLSYTAGLIVEFKKMVVEKAMNKMSVEDILEEERRRFFAAHCFLRGATVVFNMANCAADLKNMWNSEVFPSLAFLNSAELAKVKGEENAPNFETSPFKKMPPDADAKYECTGAGVHPDFNVVMISYFSEEDYVDFLQDMVPLELMQVIKPIAD